MIKLECAFTERSGKNASHTNSSASIDNLEMICLTLTIIFDIELIHILFYLKIYNSIPVIATKCHFKQVFLQHLKN